MDLLMVRRMVVVVTRVVVLVAFGTAKTQWSSSPISAVVVKNTFIVFPLGLPALL
jgi:hypothetical protein